MARRKWGTGESVERGQRATERLGEGVLEIEGLPTKIRMRSSTVTPVDGCPSRSLRGRRSGWSGIRAAAIDVAMSIMRLLPPGGRIADGASGSRDSGADRALRAGDAPCPRQRARIIFQDPMTSLNPRRPWASRSQRRSDYTGRDAEGGRGARRRDARPRRCAEAVRTAPGTRTPLGGLRQRDVIAIALASSPRCHRGRADHRARRHRAGSDPLAARRPQDRLGMGVLLITHDMRVIAEHVDRVLVMYAGEIVVLRGTTSSGRCGTPTRRRCWSRVRSSTGRAAAPSTASRAPAEPVAELRGVPLPPSGPVRAAAMPRREPGARRRRRPPLPVLLPGAPCVRLDRCVTGAAEDARAGPTCPSAPTPARS